MTAARKSWWFDRTEQAIALILYVYLLKRLWPENASITSLGPAMLLLSEGMIILFLLIRRPTENISIRPVDWLVALVGTGAPLLVTKSAAPQNPEIGVFLILFGMFVQLTAKISLWRSFGLVAANRGIKTGGAYRYVRHPMYLGYMISHVGFLITSPLIMNIAVYLVCWTCLILRINFEERLLSTDTEYRKFMNVTPFRLVPGVY